MKVFDLEKNIKKVYIQQKDLNEIGVNNQSLPTYIQSLYDLQCELSCFDENEYIKITDIPTIEFLNSYATEIVDVRDVANHSIEEIQNQIIEVYEVKANLGYCINNTDINKYEYQCLNDLLNKALYKEKELTNILYKIKNNEKLDYPLVKYEFTDEPHYFNGQNGLLQLNTTNYSNTLVISRIDNQPMTEKDGINYQEVRKYIELNKDDMNDLQLSSNDFNTCMYLDPTGYYYILEIQEIKSNEPQSITFIDRLKNAFKNNKKRG